MRSIRKSFLLSCLVPCILAFIPAACVGSAEPDGLAPAPAPLAGDPEQPVSSPTGPLPGRIVLKLEASLSASLREHLARGRSLSSFRFPDSMAELHARYGVTAARPVFAEPASDTALRERIRQLIAEGRALDPDRELPHLQDIFELALDPAAPTTRAALEYSLVRDHVVAAEPLFAGTPSSCAPSEPLYPSQWAPDRIDADLAWCSATGAGQTVAIVDTGIDDSHPELAPSTSPVGFDCTTGPGAAPSFNGPHGTGMASVVGAAWDGAGMAGMAPDATLISVNITDASGVPDPTCTAQGIQYSATVAGIQNVSLAFRATSFLLEDAIAAAHALDSYVVSASGNDTSIFAANPALQEWGTAVGASTSADLLWPISNTGSKLDVVGPGESIVHAVPGGGFATGDGTSLGTAHVSGLVALIREVQPTWNVEQVRQAVRQGADDVNGGGFDTDMGHGRINAENSVHIALSGIPRPTSNIVSPKFDQRIRGKTLVKGFSDLATGATGGYGLEWSSSLAGPYFPVSNGTLTGGAAPGLVTLGAVSNGTFPGPGRYFLRLTTRDVTNNLESIDYNEIESCGGCAPAPSGMIAWWPFDVSTWPVAKDIIGGNDGSYTGHAVPGYEGYVRHAAGFFARAGDAVHAPTTSPPAFYEMGVSAWVRRNNPVSDGIIASYRATSTRGWELGISAGDNLYFSTNMMTGTLVTHSINLALLDDFRYHHIAAVVRRADPTALVPLEIVLYVDGAPLCWGSYCATQFVPSATFPTPSSPEYILGGGASLGYFTTSELPFDGNLDEIQIFESAPTDAEIAAQAGAGCGGTCQ